ncbi:hypothetical protein [Actinomyces slackii]|nr:hypothetical protein [Actinomyces slackii]
MSTDLPVHHRALALRSALDLPIIERHALEAETLRRVAGVDRMGDLTRYNTCEVTELADLTPAASLLAPDERGWALGHALVHAVEHGQRLWLCETTPQEFAALRRALGEDLVHNASLEALPESEPTGPVVAAVSPRDLLDAWAVGDAAQVRYLRTVLKGTDPLRVPSHILAALEQAQVDLVPRSKATRLLHNPKFLAYLIIFIYSSLRVVPAALAPGFKGNPWVLWGIDIVTALPYTWGIMMMVAGRRLRHRMAGTLVTLVTFIAPYVYFFARGKGYPPWVLYVVAALVIGTVLLEGGRWLRDVIVARGLTAAQPQRPGRPQSPRDGRSLKPQGRPRPAGSA